MEEIVKIYQMKRDAETLAAFKKRSAADMEEIANRESLKDEWKAKKIRDFVMLLKSVMNARNLVVLEMTVREENLEKTTQLLPAVETPYISKSHTGQGYMVRAIVNKEHSKRLIPMLEDTGAVEIMEYPVNRLVSTRPSKELRNRQHTAEHVLFRTLVNKFGVKPRSVQFEKENVRMDVMCEGADLRTEMGKVDIEAEVNDVLAKNLAVKTYFVSKGTAERNGISTLLLPDGMDAVRIVEIGDGYDRQACLGIHVENTKEVGKIKLLGDVERKGKDVYRIKFSVT